MPWSCGHVSCPTHSSPEHRCPGWVLAKLSGSVGAGGKNEPDDVTTVQGALNGTWNNFDRGQKLATSGKVDPKLLEAIRTFQRFGVGSKKPDGRIDVRGVTAKALSKRLERKRIVVSLDRQELYALLDGRCVMKFPCATGDADHPTDPGVFRITRQRERYKSKTYGSSMDYAMFFTSDGKAIHQYHGPLSEGIVSLRVIHILKKQAKNLGADVFGSHGCVRLEGPDAKRLFHWTPRSTEVHVY